MIQALRRGFASFAIVMCVSAAAYAQEPPPRIGPFVLDLHGVVPTFGDDPLLAASRGLNQAELPGSGLGLSGSLHFYLPRIAGITIGLGGEVIIASASASPPPPVTTTTTTGTTTTTTTTPAIALRAVTETFKEFSPQLSLNFGNGHGWSYLSGGIGQANWTIVPDGALPTTADDEILGVFNYGGGARWFAKPHLAFSLDVRFYAIDAGTPRSGFPGTPRTLLLVIGAGVSIK